MGAQIMAHVQPMEHPSKFDFSAAISLSENLIREAFAPIDLPSADADAFTREFIYTPTAKIQLVKMERERMAKEISESLTNLILDAMSHADTTMGY